MYEGLPRGTPLDRRAPTTTCLAQGEGGWLLATPPLNGIASEQVAESQEAQRRSSLPVPFEQVLRERRLKVAKERDAFCVLKAKQKTSGVSSFSASDTCSAGRNTLRAVPLEVQSAHACAHAHVRRCLRAIEAHAAAAGMSAAAYRARGVQQVRGGPRPY